MNETLLMILVFGGLAATIGYFVWQRNQRRSARAEAENYDTVQTQTIINTLTESHDAIPGEMPRILFRPGKMTPEMLAGVRDGFAERILKAQNVMGWSRHLDPALCTVLVFPSVSDYTSDGIYAPSFQVFFKPGSPYDESVYDKEPGKPGGWLFAAEKVLTSGNALLPIFIIAENNSAEYSARVTSYALDHLFAYHNDFNLYSATADHSQGGGHPLW